MAQKQNSYTNDAADLTSLATAMSVRAMHGGLVVLGSPTDAYCSQDSSVLEGSVVNFGEVRQRESETQS